MKILEERIIEDGIIINNDILKVDSFINHQIDVALVRDLAKEINNEFKNLGVNKILTIETSGIAFAYAVAEEMGNLPLVFGKKSKNASMKILEATANRSAKTIEKKGLRLDLSNQPLKITTRNDAAKAPAISTIRVYFITYHLVHFQFCNASEFCNPESHTSMRLGLF